MNIEINLTGAVPDYGMYTDFGNSAIHDVVLRAREHDWSWAETLNALRALAEHEPFGEAMDTAVREYVYSALGQNEPFYQ